MMIINNNSRILISAALAAALFAGTAAFTPAPVLLAAPPVVEVDEGVYINLDHYGKVTEVNVVKTCAMNGNDVYKDYGDYTEVINLTNGAAPRSDGKSVTWDLKGYDCDVFYFEGRSKEIKGELPWEVDVSYLLNGKPVKAEDLPGASGVVSTLIKAIPNKKADAYFRDNMILTTGMLLDMQEDNFSIDAPGSQLQSIGTKKAVIFVALPGEEGDYRIDVGTDSYESLGIFMAMVPATLSSLDKISDLREVKDKVRDSLDAMSDSSDVIFDSLRDTKASLEETKAGLEKAREAKGIYDGGRDQVKSDVDAAIDSLDGIEEMLGSLSGTAGVVGRDYGSTMDEMNTIRQSVYGMDEYVKDLEEASYELESSLGKLKKALKEASSDSEALEGVKEALEGAKKAGADISTGDIQTAGLVAQLGMLMGDLSKDTSYAAEDTQALIHEIANLSAKCSEVLNETNALGGRIEGEYRQHVSELIDETSIFLDKAAVSTLATKTALRSMRALMDSTETALSKAVDSSISGLIGIINGGLGITDGSEVFRNAKDVMKSAVDDELDELEEDSNILNIDTSKELVSFTSDKNNPPKSVQIILRTDEIKKDEEAELLDAEPQEKSLTVGQRVMNVVKKILPFFD